MEQAIFAAGDFVRVKSAFQAVPGVISVSAGYAGGTLEDPTHEEVISETSGHAEAVHLEYDPEQVSFEQLCKLFFDFHDPTQLNQQAENIGTAFRSAIFYVTDDQKVVAEAVIDELQKSTGSSFVTELLQAGPFYDAEDQYQS